MDPKGRETKRGEGDLIEKVIEIKRVSKKTKGGNQISFTALVVVGDGKGRVGFALERAKDVASAIRKGMRRARREMVEIPLKNGTIPFPVEAKFKAAKVLIKPARPGTGLIVGGPLRVLADAAGIEDLVARMLGSRNKVANIRAALKALSALRREK